MNIDLSNVFERGNRKVEVNQGWALRYWTREAGGNGPLKWSGGLEAPVGGVSGA